MVLAFFRNAVRLSFVHPLFMHSFCQAISFASWSLLKFRLARFMQFALLDACTSLPQHAFPSAKEVPAVNTAAATKAKVVLIMSIRYLNWPLCSISERNGYS